MNTQLKQRRILYLDYIKAFAIILVIIGHVLQYMIWPSDFDEHYIWNFTTVQRNYPIGSVDLNRNHSSDVLV